MNEPKKTYRDRSSLIIGGCTMIGVGVGFFLLQYSALYFVGSVLAGIGLGLVLGTVLGDR